MNVSVRFSAPLAQLLGTPRLVVELSTPATVADLIEHLSTEHPDLAPRLRLAVPVIGGQTVSRSSALQGGQEVAFLVPVAGGARSLCGV